MRFPGKSAPAAFASAGSSKHGNGSTFSLGILAAMLVCAAAFLGIGAPAAGAATPGESYSYTKDIGTTGAGVAQEVGLVNVVAVSSEDGNVFIVRQTNGPGEGGAVDVIDPATDTSLSRPFTNVLPGGVAVSPDGSYFFVLDGLISPAVEKYVREGSTYTQDTSWSASGLAGPTGIALDPSTGDLLLSDSGKVKRFDSTTGELISSFDGSSAGPFTQPRSLAVAPNGDIYVVDLSGRILHFAADGSSKGSLLSGGVATGIAVNPQTGEVAVDQSAAQVIAGAGYVDATIRVFSATNDLEDVIVVPAPLSVPDGTGGSNNKGLAFSPDGSKLYVGLSDGSVHVYSRGTQPGVDAPVVSDITTTGAHLSANVATAGEPTTARIEYCLAADECERNLTSEGSSPWKRLAEETGLSSDPGEDTIAGDVTGLLPNTKYLVRTYAVNEGNKVENRSATRTLTTAVPPPLVTTAAASDLGDTSAQLVGSVDNTFGDLTTFHFEYGLTTDYGSRLPTGAEGIAGNLRTPRTFSRLATGLQPGTTYHFRLVATNSGGTTAGADQTFTTLGVDQLPPSRAYEQVTPVNKEGLSLQVGFGVQAAADGSAFEYATTSPSSNGASAAVVQRYVAWRGTSDWNGANPVDPPVSSTSGTVLLSPTLGVSGDFEHALVVSQHALAPGAVEGAANVYVHDLDSGGYRFVGSSSELGAFGLMTGTTEQDKFIAGAPDFSWVVFISKTRLLPDAPKVAMYRWTAAGGLSLLSLLPDGSVPTGGVHPQGTTLISNRWVSDDGAVVLYSLQNGDDGLYRRSDDQTEEVSVGHASGGPTGLQPAVGDGLSSNGRFVFFHTASQLTDADTDGVNSEYRYDSSTGQMEYLGPQDGTNDGMIDTEWLSPDGGTVYFNSNKQLVVWREGQGVDVVAPFPVRADSFGSPNGRFLEFRAPDESVRLYDAEAGELVCLSCSAGGVASPGGLPNGERNISNRRPQAVTDDGHAFFSTSAALLNVDRNAKDDVYEYFKGRLTLISPGDTDFAATFLDISEDGSNVFFATAQGLVSRDTDGGYDIYDARIGGGFAAQNPPPPPGPCAGDACQGAGSSPPPLATPATLGSKGSGNAKPRKLHCAKNTRKVSRHGKTRCVKKSKHKSKKRDAKHNRGAGR